MASQDPAKDSAADPRTQGLERLMSAVGSTTTVRHVQAQRAWVIPQRVALCRLWRPEDTATDFAQRHPEYGTRERIMTKMAVLRRFIPAAPPRAERLSGWQIAQLYLASIPSGYLRNIEP